MKLIILIFALAAVSCTANKPTPSIPTPPPIVVAPASAVAAQITAMAATSGAAKYYWKSRGKAPLGYIKGMALAYARAYCSPNTVVASKTLGSSDRDALKHYDIAPSNKNTYAFLIGLGMRESSGKYCEGRDMSASNTSSSSAEAGMFQTSYDSHTASKALDDMMNEYHQKCYLEVFKEGVTCRDSTNYGSGAGLIFQQMAKTCPTFAVEYAAITLRTLRRHYGPINRREVDFRPEVLEVLSQVEKIIDLNPSACSEL